jgi:hypothetical protein
MTLLPDPSDISMETNVLRRQTAGYIAANPTSVELMRAVTAPDGAGGKRTSRPTARPAQTVRIIQAAENQETVRTDAEGNNVRPDLNMMMEWDGDVAKADQFTWHGYLCEVVYVQDMNYEKMVEVVIKGQAT